jgi:predicted phosphodiesterase
MTSILLFSDTHSFLDEKLMKHFDEVDEIWHAGDFGNAAIADELKIIKPLRGVYGNCREIRERPKRKSYLC